jgi:hypothetical protein
LAKHAWSEGYWIAAVGQIPGQRYSALRNWPAEKWASALSHAIRRHGWRFVFAGTPDEQTFSRKVLDLLGPDAGSVLLQPDGDLDLLLGMIALSDGYFGRDCGPMHLAAALGKPVVAVFGGGAWPRFSPRGDCTWTVTIGVPCVGCYWHCCVGDSYCIKDTPVAAVTAALDEAAAGHGPGQRLNVLACEPALAERIAREAAQTARDLSRQLHERSFAAQARKATLVARLPPTIARFLHRRLGRGDHQSS